MFVRIATTLSMALGAFSAAAGDVPPPVATVSAVQGQVLHSHKADISPAQEGSILAIGDRLMALEDAQASIAYADGCEQILTGEDMLTIGERSECVKLASLEPRSFRQAIGDSGGGSDSDRDKPAVVVVNGSAAETTGTGLTVGQQWLVAAAIILPAVYLYDRNRRDDNDRPPVSQ